MKSENQAPVRGDWKSSRRRTATERFLDLFSEAEQALKKRLGRLRADKSTCRELLRDYVKRNSYWREDADDLHLHAEIGNLLTHQRSVNDGQPVQVPQRTVDRLEAILHRLDHAVPIRQKFCRPVSAVHLDECIDHVLRLAFENAFSQFPVVDRAVGRFQGLITEDSVARFLGRWSKEGEVVIDLSRVQVSQVIREEEPDRKDTIFRFRKPQDPEDEVMGMFAFHPSLEVVLLTEDGSNKTLIQGIITAWNAARYPSGEIAADSKVPTTTEVSDRRLLNEKARDTDCRQAERRCAEADRVIILC